MIRISDSKIIQTGKGVENAYGLDHFRYFIRGRCGGTHLLHSREARASA
jgi:hypothetical protein